jgi:DNA-directed RNA polymerase subunit RPC12/RpoP
MSEETAPMVCGTCGRTPQDESTARLTWGLGVEQGRRVWTCEECSRRYLRSMEGKLDSTWW